MASKRAPRIQSAHHALNSHVKMVRLHTGQSRLHSGLTRDSKFKNMDDANIYNNTNHNSPKRGHNSSLYVNSNYVIE